MKFLVISYNNGSTHVKVVANIIEPTVRLIINCLSHIAVDNYRIDNQKGLFRYTGLSLWFRCVVFSQIL